MDKNINSHFRNVIDKKTRDDKVSETSAQESLIQTKVEQAADMVALIDQKGKFLYTSPSSLILLGLNSEQLNNQILYELIHSVDCKHVRHALESLRMQGDSCICEFRMRHTNGIIFWVEMYCQRVHGNVEGEMVAVLRDNSLRHREMEEREEERHQLEHEEAARRWQRDMAIDLMKNQMEEHGRDKYKLESLAMRYTALVENNLTGVYLHDGHKLVFCNERFAEIFGFEHGSQNSICRHGLFSDDRSLDAFLTDSRQEEQAEGTNCEGRKIWLRVNRTRVFSNGINLVAGNVIDITEQVATRKRLTESERELHILSAQLMAAQELERKRIANELHDGLGQRLSAIKFAVENISRTIVDKIDPEQSRRMTAIIESMRDSIEEVRRVSMDLRPSILDDLGLIATVGWFCREFGVLFPSIGIHRNVRANEADIPGEIKVVVFRIIQEAFHNIAKHSHATKIELNLVTQDGSLCLMIRDNGCGISTIDCSPCAKGLGLKSMRERAELSQGQFRIDSVMGQGTVIQVEWPRALKESPNQ